LSQIGLGWWSRRFSVDWWSRWVGLGWRVELSNLELSVKWNGPAPKDWVESTMAK